LVRQYLDESRFFMRRDDAVTSVAPPVEAVAPGARVAAGVQAVYREATAVAAAMAEVTGLHSTDRNGLRALDLLAAEPQTVGWLAEQLGLSSAATTSLVDRLERAALVRRTADPADRRRVRVELTARARRFAERELRPVRRRLQAAMAGASDAELAVVADFLERFTETGPVAEPARRP
jgi:DNA-binding MarR family transcriptional regulator